MSVADYPGSAPEVVPMRPTSTHYERYPKHGLAHEECLVCDMYLGDDCGFWDVVEGNNDRWAACERCFPDPPDRGDFEAAMYWVQHDPADTLRCMKAGLFTRQQMRFLRRAIRRWTPWGAQVTDEV